MSSPSSGTVKDEMEVFLGSEHHPTAYVPQFSDVWFNTFD